MFQVKNASLYAKFQLHGKMSAWHRTETIKNLSMHRQCEQLWPTAPICRSLVSRNVNKGNASPSDERQTIYNININFITFPDSIRHRLCGLPLSTSVTRSFRNARKSTYTVERSGLEAPCHKRNNTYQLKPRNWNKRSKRSLDDDFWSVNCSSLETTQDEHLSIRSY
jgi:hypothetical protein